MLPSQFVFVHCTAVGLTIYKYIIVHSYLNFKIRVAIIFTNAFLLNIVSMGIASYVSCTLPVRHFGLKFEN